MSDDGLTPLTRAIAEIRDLKARLAAVESQRSEPIAIVGMGMRFPGGVHDPESFWQLLWNGVDAIGEVPPERWPIDRYYDPDPDTPGRMATRYGGFLPDVDLFDAAFFGISPREAESMDPQQRLLLEVTWEALEHAGIPTDSLNGSRTGVFAGITTTDYFRMLLRDQESIDTFTTTGNAPSVGAGRISYLLGLEGPNVAIDTACSSSLVAVHLAVQSLRSGESDLALAAGVGLILAPELTINFSRARMLAPDGRCKTFDAAADGYVRSEGCGVVVLKRLSDAIAAGDTVLAVVRGTAINQDGRSGGLTAPNGPSQERVIEAALADGGVEPAEVGYVEAHGTGTPLGDPIEVRALGSVLCSQRSDDAPLLLGSVKTNLGHLEAAAGVAGLIKAVLMVQRGSIPPHLHLNELNPHIAAERLPIAIPTEPMAWPSVHDVRIAGVSSFGLSGTNAHVLVAQPAAVEPGPASPVARRLHLLPVSARNAAALRELAEAYAEQLDHDDLADVAASAATRRTHHPLRLAVVADDARSAAEQLRAHARGERSTVITGGPVVAERDVAFLFTGHGSHYAGMGSRLYEDDDVFRAAIDQCADLLRSELDHPLTEVLFGDRGLLDDMRYAQPGLFSLQYALAERWRAWGVRPSVVAGHSAGEYAAAVVAGVLDLPDAMRIVVARGRLMQRLPADGEMVAIFLDEATVAEAVAGRADDVGTAAVNGPATTVISGRRDAVEQVLAELRLAPDDFRRLDVPIAAHSPLVEPILDEFEAVVRRVDLSPPRLTLLSSMTGTVVGRELTDPGYWRRHLRQPVRFAAVFDTLREAGLSAFVEVGPNPTLIKLGQRCWPDDSPAWAPSLQRDRDELEQMLDSVGVLYTAGVAVDWAEVTDARNRTRVPLPTYPWQRQRFWADAARETSGPSRRSSTDTPRWSAAADAARRQAQQAPLDLRADTYVARWQALDAIATAAIVNTLLDLGLFGADGEQRRSDELTADGRLIDTYRHLGERWLRHLEADGLLVRIGEAFVAPARLQRVDLAPLIERAAEVWDGASPLLAYIERCATRMSEIVRGAESALTTLFPDGSYETVDFLYHHWAVARYMNGIVAATVAGIAGARPGVRVLEVGAGTGGTTAAVLTQLPAGSAEYTFTDVSDFFLARARERFADATFVRYELLDLERDPVEQGFTHGSYDVVVAANVLHATRNLDTTLSRVRDLLAPGGVLVAYEATRHPRWFDVTTGLIEGWQLFEDEWRTDHPLLDPARWRSALEAAGFAEIDALPGDDLVTSILGQHVILAATPGDDAALRPDDVTEQHEQTRPGTVTIPDAGEIAAALADAVGDERQELLVDLVRRTIARVLRIADPARVEREQPLLDLGFDSLMAVELRDVLRTALSLPRTLPATLVFDHPTVVAIASHLDRLLRGETSGADDPGGAPPPAASEPTNAEAIATLSDDEVEAMLLKKLADMQEAP